MGEFRIWRLSVPLFIGAGEPALADDVDDVGDQVSLIATAIVRAIDDHKPPKVRASKRPVGRPWASVFAFVLE